MGAHVAVPGRGVDADVERDVELGEVRSQPLDARAEDAVSFAVTANDRRQAAEALRVLRHVPVEGADGSDFRASGMQQGEAAADAEADCADAPPVDSVAGGEEALGAREDVEGTAFASLLGAPEFRDRAHHAECPEAASEEVGGECRVAGVGEARRDPVDVLVQTEDLVQHQQAGAIRGAARAGESPRALVSHREGKRDILQVAHGATVARGGPMAATHSQPAWQLADSVRSGSLSASELLEHQLARIDAHNESLGAFVFVDPERARARAAEVDATVAAGRDPGPLAGLPLGVKVLEDVAGWPHTMAAKVFADRVATTTSTQVERLLRAGAVPLGLTASPEMGSASHTTSLLYGTCRNPWDATLTPGGSSGGSAAAVAAGLVPLATGSDSGGSLRIPAAYCGVVGFKGTYGRVPRGPGYVGMPNVRNYGVIARSVRDVGRALDATAGAHETDPLSLPHPGPPFETSLGEELLAARTVTWSADLGFGACDPEIEERAAAAAEQLGEVHGWKRRAFAGLPDPGSAWQVLGSPDVVGLYGPLLADHREEIAPFLRDMVERGAKLSTPAFAEAAVQRQALVHALAALFEEVDLLLLPTVACPAFAAEGPPPAAIGGRAVDLLHSVAQTVAFNLSGHPAVSVPIGLVGGAPVALQIVGRRHEDARVLAAAASWERLAPWPAVAPAYE